MRVGPPLPRFTLAYEMYGPMNADRSNVVLLYHAMTGSQHAAGLNTHVEGLDGRWTDELHEGWWDGFIGPGKAVDTDRFCVVCANFLGGCYGSTGPASINPETGARWGPSFPVLRMCDVVESQMKLLDHLGVRKLHAVVGASLGGFLALLTATQAPRPRPPRPADRHRRRDDDLSTILNFEQVTAIEADPHFQGGDYYDGPRPDVGLALARRIAHKTFISPDALRDRARGGGRQPTPSPRLVRDEPPGRVLHAPPGAEVRPPVRRQRLSPHPRRLAVVQPRRRGRRQGLPRRCSGGAESRSSWSSASIATTRSSARNRKNSSACSSRPASP